MKTSSPPLLFLLAAPAFLVFLNPSVALGQQTERNLLVLPGTGSATDENYDTLERRYRNMYRQAGINIGEVLIIRPDEKLGVRGYSDDNINDAINFINQNGGRNLDVATTSEGGWAFRDILVKEDLTNRQFGAVWDVEPFSPFRKPLKSTPPGFDPEVYSLIETDYSGDWGRAFREGFGTGSLMPGCSPPLCYYYRNGSFEVNSLREFTDGFTQHGVGVVNGENLIQVLSGFRLREGPEAHRNRLEQISTRPPSGPPNQPTNPGQPPPISGGGGGGAAGGGGVGVESFPIWLDVRAHRAAMEKVNHSNEMEVTK